MIPNGTPDETWKNKDILLKIVGEVGELKGEVRHLNKGLDNHLKHHFRLNLALVSGMIAIAITGLYFYLSLLL